MTALFEFNESFVDVVAPDVVAMARDARRAFGEVIDESLPRDLNTYWDGDDYVIDLTATQTAAEFGQPGQPPQPLIRQSLLSAMHKAKSAAEGSLTNA